MSYYNLISLMPKTAGIDPDAQAFITAAAITDPTQQAAINTLVVDLKGYSIWTKMKAIYPVVGGSASSHAVNLKTPGTFNLTFTNAWTHSSTGMTPNGSSAYANTGFNPLTQSLPRNSASMGVYNRTNTVNAGGHGQRVSNNFELFDPWSDNRVYCYINNGSSGINVAVPNSLGLIQGSRTTSTAIAISQNNTIHNSSFATTGDSNGDLWIGASNNGGSGTFFNNREIAFFYIGEGFNNTEMQNIYTAVQTYQTTLGRSIGTQTVSDADAQAFINAAAIDDQVQATAINNLVIGMKADGLWTKMKAIYPIVGGVASSHAVNLKTPGTYNLTNLNTGWTHTANGMTSLNTFAGTGIQPSTVLGLDDTHLSYFTTGAIDSTAACMIGAYTAPNRLAIYTGGYFGVNSSAWSSYTYSGGGAKFRIISRLSSTVQKFANNGTIQTVTLNSSVRPTANIELARLGGATDNFNGICKFASVGDGLTDTDIANFNTRVTTYQTALSRYN